MIDQNGNTQVIELSKVDGEKMGPILTTPVNKDFKEVNQQTDRPKVTILRPKELQDQGTSIKKPIKVVFERATHKMGQHLKPLYIKGHVEKVTISRILIDGRFTINIMPQIMSRILQKFDSDLIPTELNV